MTRHDAPWGRQLIIVSGFASFICVATAGLMLQGPAAGSVPGLLAGLLPLLILASATLFMVRGYVVADGELLVMRPLWRTRLPLAGLRGVEVLPDAMRASVRTWGNGGLFSYTGRYRNRALGPYQAWVNDMKRTVVLRFAERTLVVSPADPEAFAQEIRRQVTA